MRTSCAFVVLVTLLSSSSPLVVQGQRDDVVVFINSIAFGNIEETCGVGSPPPEVTTLAPGQTTLAPGATQPPGEGTDAPGEGTDAPGEGTDAPGEGTDAPGEGTDAPGEGTDAPGEGTDAPGEGTDAPVEGTDAPVEGTDPPVEATDPPAEATDPPAEATEAPATAASGAFAEDVDDFAEFEKWVQAAEEAKAPRRRLNTDGPTSIHVEIASGASVASGDYELTAVTGDSAHPVQTVPITSEYLFHTEFIYHKFDIESGDSIATGCVYLTRTVPDQDPEYVSCVSWGEAVCPCLNPTVITGEVADGNLWALQLPTVEGETVPFLGAEQGDFIPGFDGVAATADNCKFGEANVGQSFAGDNNSTAMINEVIFQVACHEAHAVYNEISAYTGIEVAAFQPDDTPVELLLVAVDHSDREGWTTISTSVAGSWNFEYVAMTNFTSSDEMFGDDLSSGFVLLLDANFKLLSSISWAKPGGVTINWDALEGAPSIGSRTYYPLVVSDTQLPIAEDGSGSYFTLTGDMAVMKDGVWSVKSDEHCTPGGVNEDQGPPTTETTAGPPGGAHKATVSGVCLSALAFAVLSHW